LTDGEVAELAPLPTRDFAETFAVIFDVGILLNDATQESLGLTVQRFGIGVTESFDERPIEETACSGVQPPLKSGFGKCTETTRQTQASQTASLAPGVLSDHSSEKALRGLRTDVIDQVGADRPDGRVPDVISGQDLDRRFDRGIDLGAAISMRTAGAVADYPAQSGALHRASGMGPGDGQETCGKLPKWIIGAAIGVPSLSDLVLAEQREKRVLGRAPLVSLSHPGQRQNEHKHSSPRPSHGDLL